MYYDYAIVWLNLTALPNALIILLDAVIVAHVAQERSRSDTLQTIPAVTMLPWSACVCTTCSLGGARRIDSE